VERFAFEFSPPLSWPLVAIGVTPWTAHVDVGDGELHVRFGPWSLTTSLSNVDDARITGPYLPFRALGPHISLADRGVTFGTSWRRGVCIAFREPVPAALPAGLISHPAATVTVAEPERLVEVLRGGPAGVPGEGDELRPTGLQAVPSGADLTVVRTSGEPDDDQSAPAPVSRPRARRTTGTTSRRPAGPRTPARRRTAAADTPEQPTPADMPKHTTTEKAPGVTPPADEDLPGPDAAP
jgi:hypothetical protein